MSDKASCGMVASILPDNIKAKIKGNMDFDISTSLSASAGDGWIYAEKTVTHAEADLLGTTEDYLGPTTGAGTVATGDKLKWIAIKHTGTTNGTSTTNKGIVFCLDANGSLANNTGDAIFLDAGDMIVLKCPNTTVADLHAMTVNVSLGMPSSVATVSGDNVRVIVAGILNNVG
jgi:hypothetical protein